MGAEEPEKKEEKPANDGEKGSSAFTKKMMKVMTIMAYISGVSGAGFLLSLYYIILWDPEIQGVRPPGYLKTGEMVGLPQARVAPMPEALVAPPSDHRKMSREYMEAYFRNLTGVTGETHMAADNSMLDPKPTPYALPVVPETNHHHSNSHQPHHNGQATLSNNNHQSPGPSPQQEPQREASPTEGAFYPDEFRKQQQHGQPPLSTSA